MENERGILDDRRLPDKGFEALWDAIIVDQAIKDRLLGQAVINYTVRPALDHSALPLHGIILLSGPPGTGKTSLARGLASRTASVLKSKGSFRFLEVEPHDLASSALGRSQQAVRHLLGDVVAETAAAGPTIVLLDEVETLAADRTKMSLEANPVDVHRATDAVLAQLDHLAKQQRNLLFIATTNFKAAIDQAFVSRCDLVVTIGLPSAKACHDILTDTIEKLALTFPKLKSLLTDVAIKKAAEHSEGLDGRRIRKAVLTAFALDKQVAMNPDALTASHVLESIKQAKREAQGESK